MSSKMLSVLFLIMKVEFVKNITFYKAVQHLNK